jgi:SAM-dependent methyltransferase
MNHEVCMNEMSGQPCRLCGANEATLCATVRSPPAGEVDYGVAPEAYRRKIFRCGECDVFFNEYDSLPENFYSGDYNEASYGQGFRSRFDKIMALPPEKSDNKQRAQRLHEFLKQKGREPKSTRVLDVGSGLGVFPAEMSRHGYLTHAVDPDPRSVEHMSEVARIEHAWVGSVDAVPPGNTFDLITLNKVLEHVEAPLGMLRQLVPLLSKGGTMYVELPDGEAAAAAAGYVERQEFFMSHLTVFGPRSLQWLVEHAGLSIVQVQRIHEPSDKYTIFALAEAS